MIDADSADNAAPPEQLLQAAARSVASGASLSSVAGWFNVPESQLEEWIASHDEPTPAEPIPSPRSVATRPRPAAPRPIPTAFVAEPPVGVTRRSGPSPMSLRDSLRVLRRRWLVLVVGLVLGASAGWFSAPGNAHRAATFRATHTLIYSGTQSYNLGQVALLATSGEVPSRVAARLKMDRSQVRSAVFVVVAAEVATISITGQSSTPDLAVALADTTAEELGAELSGRDRAAYDKEIGQLKANVDAARKRLNAVPAKEASGQAAARAEVDAAERAVQQYQATTPEPKPGFQTLEVATASAVNPPGVQAPDSKPVRAALLGLFGLLAGFAGALALDRRDSRIRSKSAAEEAFGVPVIAEVPRLAKDAQGQLLARTQPSSPFVEAYRSLRTYVALWAPANDREDGHRVIVVTSPSPGEGKTTTVAHLAAMLAEIGRSVIVISADLRRPRLHTFFDLPGGPGLVDALDAKTGLPVFTGLDRVTTVRGVRLVPSGPPVANPAPLFEHAEHLVQAFRRLADFVLIDAPPLLVANDAVEMARHADGVLLVARAGETPVEAAERCAETLGRLEIPVVGSVLMASEAASNASRYYASRYYAEPEPTGRLRRRGTAAGGHAAGETPAGPASD
jgi:capsular exopolysaccharide synthesis family protein